MSVIDVPRQIPSSGTRRPPRFGHIDPTRLPAPIDGAIQVRTWDDPYLAIHGHDIRSSYVELFWLGILGPSATLLLRRLGAGLRHSPDGFRLPIADTARSLGLGVPTSRSSQFIRALHRCVIFKVARFEGDILEVRPQLPSLHAGQLERLPESLQAAHALLGQRHPDRTGAQVDREASDPPAAVASRQRASVQHASDRRFR